MEVCVCVCIITGIVGVVAVCFGVLWFASVNKGQPIKLKMGPIELSIPPLVEPDSPGPQEAQTPEVSSGAQVPASDGTVDSNEERGRYFSKNKPCSQNPVDFSKSNC